MMASTSPRPGTIAAPRSALLFMLTALVGCGGPTTDAPEGKGDASTSENRLVVVDGSSTVFRISKAASEEFTGSTSRSR